ncbi:MAG: two-component system, OmpR family, response regulator [Acidimicrobiaceae bacterium]
MRVLVVDDEPKMADVLRRALVRDGYAVDVVGNGTDAIWAASNAVYDAVVLDAMIPGPDGFEVCGRLRADQTSPAAAASFCLTFIRLMARSAISPGVDVQNEGGANEP